VKIQVSLSLLLNYYSFAYFFAFRTTLTGFSFFFMGGCSGFSLFQILLCLLIFVFLYSFTSMFHFLSSFIHFISLYPFCLSFILLHHFLFIHLFSFIFHFLHKFYYNFYFYFCTGQNSPFWQNFKLPNVGRNSV
jgi:hypothetical protein